MNSINYDKFKFPDTLISQFELISYIAARLTQQNINCIIADEFAAEFYTGSFYRAQYISVLINGDIETADKILSEIGFIKQHGFYVLDSSKIGFAVYIKVKLTLIPSEEDKLASIKCQSGFVIKIIGLEELVIEYICDYHKYGSFRKYEQIIAMIFIHYDNIDMEFIYKKCVELNMEQVLIEFIEMSKRIKKAAENENS